MLEDKICPKCGYANRLTRITCKNCGEALSGTQERKQVIDAKRKKPLVQSGDWIKAAFGIVSIPVAVFLVIFGLSAVASHAWIGLLFLAMGVAFIYAGLSLFLLPLFYRYQFMRGHMSTAGSLLAAFEKEYDPDRPPEQFVVVYFVPEKARDPLPRRLKCQMLPGTKIWSTGDDHEIVVYYALVDPAIMLLAEEM